jgi:peptide/nickel transport system substrate-binding protein
MTHSRPAGRLGWAVVSGLLVAVVVLPGSAARAAEPAPSRLVPEIKLVIPSAAYDNTRFESGMLIARGWEQLGLKIQVITVPDWPNFTKRVDAPWENHAFICAYIARAERLDPDELLTRPLHSRSIQKGGGNYAGYHQPEYDAVVDAGRAELDVERRRALVWKAQEIVARDLPHITLFHKKALHVYNKRKWGDVVSIPGSGFFNILNYVDAAPLTRDTTMVMSEQGDFTTLNPFWAPSNWTSVDISRIVFDTLSRIGPDMKPMPWAASSWVARGPTVVEVRLRKGMTFHDGRPVTAEDLEFSYGQMKKWRVPLYAGMLEPLKDVRVIDPHTARIELEQPYAPLYMQTFAMVPIVPKHIWEPVLHERQVASPEQWNDPRSLIGSGPFRFVHLRGNEATLVANDDHFHPPKARTFVVALVSNVDAQFLGFRKGEYDFHTGRGLTTPQMKEAQGIAHLGVVETDDIGVYWLNFNLRENSPFRDYALRKAAAHMIDYGTLVKSILAGLAAPGRGLVAPGNKFWHNATIPDGEVEGRLHYHRYDPAQARRILQEAGYRWDSQGRLAYPEDHRPDVFPKSAARPADEWPARVAHGEGWGRPGGPGCQL